MAGRGVCGSAYATGETVCVADVHDFPGHIACDAQTQSEIVVPVKSAGGTIVAVLDIDSTLANAFDDVDRQWLEQMAGFIGRSCDW
ncbi:MAG: hypothetical protein M1814_002662 [Vezdaea aestivalis]|nr:MAG: hypothetical protein M1814_002662 [Vezdaea aestivalis]